MEEGKEIVIVYREEGKWDGVDRELSLIGGWFKLFQGGVS